MVTSIYSKPLINTCKLNVLIVLQTRLEQKQQPSN